MGDLDITHLARNLSKDTLVTITDEHDTTYNAKVANVNTHAGDNDITTVHLRDAETFESLGSLTISPTDDHVTIRPAGRPRPDDAPYECTNIETHGQRVDWDEPVRTSESGLTYVVDCPECGGVMSRNGQHWRRSRESYGCHDCGHEDSWRRRNDMVRKPTRREWAEHKLTDPSPFVTIAERYIPDGYDLPGYYFREACDDDPAHYTRTSVSETGSAEFHQFDDLKLGVCPECGADTTARTRTYEDGVNEFGEPENHGDLPTEFTDALDRVREENVDLFIPNDPDEENWGYLYEGVSFNCPWHGYEDSVIVTLDDDGDLFLDIVNMGGIKIKGGSYGKDVGLVAWWFTNTDKVEERPRNAVAP